VMFFYPILFFSYNLIPFLFCLPSLQVETNLD
jgi:hypothetical protein